MMTNNNVQSALTDRDNLDSKIDLLRDVVTHLLDDTLERRSRRQGSWLTWPAMCKN